METYDPFAFLLDLPKGSDGGEVDPDFAVRAKGRGRVFLAGKLTPENVADRIGRVFPWGVDVAGGTEASPGVKDRSRMRDFIRAAREASAAGSRQA